MMAGPQSNPPDTFTKGSDVVFVLDCSRSMGDKLGDARISKLELAKASLVSIFTNSGFRTQDRIGVVAVNTNFLGKPMVRHVVQLGELRSSADGIGVMIERVMLLKNDGGTALYAGLVEGLRQFSSRTGLDSNLLVMTDQGSGNNISPGKIIAEAKKFGVKIHFVVLGDGKVKEKFSAITESTGGKAFYVQNQFELERSMFQSQHFLRSEQPSAILLPSAKAGQKSQELGVALRVTPKLPKATSIEQIQKWVNDLTQQYQSIESDLKAGKISQAAFAEKYSIIQYELNDLRESVREARSKVSKEMMEVGLATDRPASADRYNSLKDTNKRLTELDRQISSLYQTKKIVT